MARVKKNEPDPAKGGLASAFEKKVRDWCDKYVRRIDREMTTAFPQLEKALLEAVDENLGMILKNQPKQFSKKVVEPAVNEWIKRTITPIHDDAARELTQVAFDSGDLLEDGFDVSRVTLMLLPAGMVAAGIAVIVGGFLVGITTMTFLGIAISTSIAWPIVLAAAAVGTALLAFGSIQLSHIKNKVSKAFTRTFIPKLRSCLIGKGFTVDKKHHDSVRRQFQEAVERTAEEILANQKPTSGL